MGDLADCQYLVQSSHVLSQASPGETRVQNPPCNSWSGTAAAAAPASKQQTSATCYYLAWHHLKEVVRGIDSIFSGRQGTRSKIYVWTVKGGTKGWGIYSQSLYKFSSPCTREWSPMQFHRYMHCLTNLVMASSYVTVCCAVRFADDEFWFCCFNKNKGRLQRITKGSSKCKSWENKMVD